MDSLLASKLLKAYQEGLTRPPQTWECRGRKFDVLFKQVFWLKIPICERLPIHGIWRLSAEGVRLSRARRLDEALAVLSECRMKLARAKISERGALLASTILESAHAYLEYKYNHFDLARVRVLDSMEADLQLERDEDFALLEMHRIQSAQNLTRIDLRAGERERALNLSSQILSYIEGLIGRLPVHHSWKGERLWARMPRSMRRALMAQVANEVVLSFSCSAQADTEELLANLPYGNRPGSNQVVHEQLRLWSLAKQAFHQADRDRYLELLPELLSMGRANAQAIWYSTLLDLLALSRELDTEASRHLREVLSRESRKWHDLPIPFRPLLGLALNEPGVLA